MAAVIMVILLARLIECLQKDRWRLSIIGTGHSNNSNKMLWNIGLSSGIGAMPRPGSAAVTMLGAAALIVLGVSGAALWLWQERARALEEGDRSARTLAHVLEEQTSRTVQAVDLTLMGIVEVLGLSPKLAKHDPSFQEALLRRLDALPYVRALFVIGPDGFITHDSGHPLTPRISLAD